MKTMDLRELDRSMANLNLSKSRTNGLETAQIKAPIPITND